MQQIKAFTLLELIIVIIIISVLASLALPRLFNVVEGSRATEAISAIVAIRSSMERCYLMNNGNYVNCHINTFAQSQDTLDIENPEKSPGAHFRYLTTVGVPTSTDNYVILAIRNNRDTTQHAGKLVTFGWYAQGIVNPNQTSWTLVYDSNPVNWDASDVYRGFIPRSN